MEDDLHLSSITKNNELLFLKKKENERTHVFWRKFENVDFID
jgi:hypothetical protein